MIRFLRGSLVIVALLVVLSSPTTEAGRCEPFRATFKMELFPHSSTPFDVYLRIMSSGCSADPGAVACLLHAMLPADAPGMDPVQALQDKCRAIVADAGACPRFVIDNVDCDPAPGQMTQFTVTDSACVGVPPTVMGDGIALASANELTALSFDPAGTVLTDYELDTVIPDCSTEGAGIVVLSGDGGSGTPIFPGGAAAFEAFLTTEFGTVTHAESTEGVSPEQMAAAQASALNDTLLAIGDPVRCTADGRILSCSNPQGPDSLSPTLAATTNDVAMPMATVGGSPNPVATVTTAVQEGGCENIANDCDALGEDITACGSAALGDVTCDNTAVPNSCSLFDVIDGIDQALGDPETCEADVNCDCAVNIFDVNCLIDCSLNRPVSCLTDACAPSGCLTTGCSAPAKSLGPDHTAFPVVVTLANPELPRNGRASATIEFGSANQPIRGMSFVVNVPSPWVVKEVESVGSARAFEPNFHQDGETLRVLLVSHDGRAMAGVDGPAVRLTLAGKGLDRNASTQSLRLLEAEAADANGRPMRLTLGLRGRHASAGRGASGRLQESE